MILTEAHLWVAMQAANSVTDADRNIVQTIHKLAESRLKDHLGYDPEQKTYTNHYYPRHQQYLGFPFEGVWDVNATHTHARLETASLTRNTLQLEHLPVRSITSIEVDSNGRFGQGTAAFPSGSAWVEGEDFWAEYEQDGLCMSGLVHASGSWPFNPGSVRVTYVAGYTRNELEGDLTGSADQKDASPLLGGVLKTCIVAYNKFTAWKKNPRTGYGGPFQSEKAQDYSYTLGKSQQDALNFLVQLPAEVVSDVEQFVHWGRMRT